MSSQTGATKVGPPPTQPSLGELEDLLYDLLASGGDLSVGADKLELIQAFLHEHARQRKTLAQFAAFFGQHGLNMRPERPNLLALPLVDAASRPMRTPPLLESAHNPLDEPPEQAAAALPSVTRSRLSWVWIALAIAAVSGALVLGVAAVIELRSELSRVHAAVAHSTLEIEQLRAETERLRELVRESSAATMRTARDTELLRRTFASPLMLNSR